MKCPTPASGVRPTSIRVLVERAAGDVAIHPFDTRISAMVFLDEMLAERDACRLTICEDERSTYSVVRSGNVWREVSL